MAGLRAAQRAGETVFLSVSVGGSLEEISISTGDLGEAEDSPKVVGAVQGGEGLNTTRGRRTVNSLFLHQL